MADETYTAAYYREQAVEARQIADKAVTQGKRIGPKRRMAESPNTCHSAGG